MKLLVVGPRGKMGRLITAIAADREEITIVGGVAPSDRDYNWKGHRRSCYGRQSVRCSCRFGYRRANR